MMQQQKIRELVEKLQRAEKRLSAARGPFVLFALFLREDELKLWDLVLSAEWLKDDLEHLRWLHKELQKELTPEDFSSLAQYVVIPTDFEDLEELYEEHPVEHGKVIVRNREFGLQFIQKGYIITCRPPVAKAA